MNIQFEIILYAFHLFFWCSFITSRMLSKGGKFKSGAVAEKDAAVEFSRSLVAIHSVAFGVMYSGIGVALFWQIVPNFFLGQRIVGATIIVFATLLAVWAVMSFRSWRLRAQLDSGHQLVTSGAFRYLRHPIYMSFNLLALGSAVWIPTGIMWFGFLLMIVGGCLRSRAEERILIHVFGVAYQEYCSHTNKFIPGIY